MTNKDPNVAFMNYRNLYVNNNDDVNLMSSDKNIENNSEILVIEKREIFDNKDKIENLDLIGSGEYWIGKDYSNLIYKDFAQVNEPFTDLIDRNKIPRMPWHDVSAVLYGIPAMDISRHFIERWNQTVVEKLKKKYNFPLLLPKCYDNLNEIPRNITDSMIECKEIQICRSLTTWSGGIKDTENSIQQAYISIIKESKKFIYIENQFFISIQKNLMVLNGIAEALYQRIIKAHSDKHEFKVYIVMPLLPGFEGQIGEKTGTFLKALIYWTNSSFNMGNKSLIQRLKTSIENPFQYISICGLRKYTELNDKLVTELIYVHSKLLIMDDECCLIGSANINDRSLLGDRDSEIAAIFKDNSNNMKNQQNNTFCSTLRKNIFK
ncbi:unnamed protein product [Gordionus sp. m RMFG-2023]